MSKIELCSPPWFYQKSSTIHLRDSQVKLNGKTVFSKLTQKIYLSISGEQASKRLVSSCLFSDLKILSNILDSYFSGMSCTFHFGQMFNAFLKVLLIFIVVWPYFALLLYHSKTLRRLVSFCSSERLVSVKNALL